ncbi:MAG: ORF6N domain-containing protein [Bacteriovoracaceae bacterium]|nr:ORF6N domain-containing protein [Bacteriovoracaceae bacterium]
MNELTLSQIEKIIYIVRGQRVMLDSDLAKLYGVETKVLNQAVKRNSERFPSDFMFQPTFSELASLRSQFVTLEKLTIQNHMKYSPRLFTENGVAMLSSVLKSKTAIQINIAIMRIFTRLKNSIALEHAIKKEISELRENTERTFRIIFERLDDLELPSQTPLINPKKIGIKTKT